MAHHRKSHMSKIVDDERRKREVHIEQTRFNSGVHAKQPLLYERVWRLVEKRNLDQFKSS